MAHIGIRLSDQEKEKLEESAQQNDLTIHVGMDANEQPIYEWATGYTKQEIFESAAVILQKYKKVDAAAGKDSPCTPYFSTYLEEWWRLYKLPKLRHTTLKTYRNLIDNHILPAFKREEKIIEANDLISGSFTAL